MCLTLLVGCNTSTCFGKATPSAVASADGGMPLGPLGIVRKGATEFEATHNDVLQAIVLATAGRFSASFVEGKGYRIDAVPPGSLLDAAGIAPKDVVLTINGVPLRGADSLVSAYAQYEKSRSVLLAIERGGATLTLTYAVRYLPHFTPPPRLPALPAPPAPPPVDLAKLDDDLVEVTPYEHVITRAAVDRVLENQAELLREARIVPAFKDGAANGVKLFGIRGGSLLARLGFANGDALQSINGYRLTDPEKALEAYAKIRTASALDVLIERQGRPYTLRVRIVNDRSQLPARGK